MPGFCHSKQHLTLANFWGIIVSYNNNNGCHQTQLITKEIIMRIAVIGAGNVGQALAGSISRAGHEVVLTAAHPEHARVAAEGLGVSVAGSNAAAAASADAVVIAVPYASAARSVAQDIAPHVEGKLVIDATNPLTPDYSGLATEGTSAAEQLQEWLPGARVAKAFNTLFASTQAQPSDTIQAPVATDDPKAKQQVISLVEAMGFAPLDVGGLKMARYLESMAFLNSALNVANGWSFSSIWKLER
jgi:predicted dinucleotide-binding enzyme